LSQVALELLAPIDHPTMEAKPVEPGDVAELPIRAIGRASLADAVEDGFVLRSHRADQLYLLLGRQRIREELVP